MAVLREIELAGSARDSAAVFDRIQEVAVFERLQESGTDSRDFVAAGGQIVHQVVQAAAINARVGLETLQCANLVIQFVEYLSPHIAARQYRQNLQERRNCCSGRPIIVSFAVAEHRMVKELQAEERPHPLRQGLLIVGSARGGLCSDFSSGFCHCAILRHGVAGGKYASAFDVLVRQPELECAP